MKENLSLYIHVPFCKAKCAYCDFVSFDSFDKREEVIASYFSALNKEILSFCLSPNFRKKDYLIQSVYIGGGTPSLVKASFIAQCLRTLSENFDLSENCEITIEANPDSLSEDKLSVYSQNKVNRISLGVQSVDDEVLKHIGRVHDFASVQKSVKLINQSEIKNYNLDLMFSLPKQSIESFRQSLEYGINSGATHLSCYGLILNEGTRLYKSYADRTYIQDDDLDADMYEMMCSFLQNNGFERYEISNFAKKGYECVHNLNCWDMIDYIGFGCAAFSCFKHTRFNNTSELDEYIAYWNNIGCENLKAAYDNAFLRSITKRNLNDEISEFIILGLRKVSGFSLLKFHERFNFNFEIKYIKLLNKFISQNLMKIYTNSDNHKYVCLTQKGMQLANVVMREFVGLE